MIGAPSPTASSPCRWRSRCLVVAWNVYIAFNDRRHHRGRGARHRRARRWPGATVIFFERNFIYYEEKQRATTDAQGVYRFTDMKTHVGQLEARTNDGRKSERRQLRLWFRAQDTEVAPLIVEAPRA